MSESEFQPFVRKQFPVQAARVTPMNIKELAEACGGQIKDDGEKEGNFSREYIKVRVAFPLNEEQTKARVGDWLVKQGRTFKVYKDKPFRSTFETRDGNPVPGGKQQKQHKPSPAHMPKKKTEGAHPEQVVVDETAHVENQVAEAVEQTPAPEQVTDAKIVGATLSEGPADPSKGVFPIETVSEEQAPVVDEAEGEIATDQAEVPEEEKKSMSLDEINALTDGGVDVAEQQRGTVRPDDEPTPGENFRGEV